MNVREPAGMTPERTDEEIRALLKAYPILSRRVLCKSLLGREVPLLLLGNGQRKLLYVAAHHGTEHITTDVLLRFVADLCEAAAAPRAPYALPLASLLSHRMLCFVPMLNPDGVSISLGIGGDPLAERRMRMCPGGDFSHWQANARGVDLNHNYAVGFGEYKRLERETGICGGAPTRYSGEGPESEPECAALAGFVRTVLPAFVLSLHSQGEEIYWRGGGVELPHFRAVALRMASLSGYRLAEPEGSAAYGGLCDYTTAALGIPSITLECGRGENPLPPRDAPMIYARLRRMLFETLTM